MGNLKFRRDEVLKILAMTPGTVMSWQKLLSALERDELLNAARLLILPLHLALT